MEHMKGPENTLRTTLGQVPFGPIGMGGMFTVIKIRERLTAGTDPGSHSRTDARRAGSVS
jgi:manganese oxidase